MIHFAWLNRTRYIVLFVILVCISFTTSYTKEFRETSPYFALASFIKILCMWRFQSCHWHGCSFFVQTKTIIVLSVIYSTKIYKQAFKITWTSQKIRYSFHFNIKGLSNANSIIACQVYYKAGLLQCEFVVIY